MFGASPCINLIPGKNNAFIIDVIAFISHDVTNSFINEYIVKKIVLLSQKGGSGKTTLAVHLAVAAERQGEKVVIIDTDPQASATAWSELRSFSTPDVTTVTASEIEKVLKVSMEVGKTFAVIDTAPHAAPGATKAAMMGDLIVIPCRPTAFDLAAIRAAVNIVKAANAKGVFVLNSCPARAPEIKEAQDTLESYGLLVVPITLGERRAYARAIASGRSVTEFEEAGKAAEEINKLWNWIKENLK